MKKVLLAIAGLMIAGFSFGQTKYGILVGPQFSKFSLENDDDRSVSDLLVRMRAGFTADLHLADEFYIGTGLLYSGKGGKETGLKLTLNYLHVPVNFLFKPVVGKGKLNLGAGPYASFAVTGKWHATDGINRGSFSVFGDEAAEAGLKMKRFDAGMGIVAGYELNTGLYIGLHTDLGLVNTMADNKDGMIGYLDLKSKNTSFGISVGAKF